VARYNAVVQRGALGELSAAAAEVAEIRELPPIGALPVPLIDKTRGWVLYEAGRYGEALAALDPAVDATIAQDAPLARSLRCVRGRVHAVRGDAARARADFEACAAPPDAPVSDPEGLIAAAHLARLAAAVGDDAEARRQLERALAALPSIAGEGVEEALAELALALARLDPAAAPPVLDALAARPAFGPPSLFRTALMAARCSVRRAPDEACDPASIGLTPELVRLMAWRGEPGDRRLADER
jgi:tetratricopeptide (TPR) repeat protein